MVPANDQSEFQFDVDITRAGPTPPDDAQVAAAAEKLLESAAPVDGVQLLRLDLAAERTEAVAQRVIDELADHLTVIGSTLSEQDGSTGTIVDVLVDSEYSSDTLAAGLANTDVVEGVVVADVAATHPEEPADSLPPGEQDGLSIYRLDDHLVVTDDFGAVVDRFAEAFEDDDVATLETEVADLQEEVESLQTHVETEMPTRGEIKAIFAPAARRFDGEGTHSNMGDVMAELDRVVGQLHALHRRGLLARAWWLLTGRLPDDDRTDSQ